MSTSLVSLGCQIKKKKTCAHQLSAMGFLFFIKFYDQENVLLLSQQLSNCVVHYGLAFFFIELKNSASSKDSLCKILQVCYTRNHIAF